MQKTASRNQRHRNAGTGKHLGKLAADIAAADHQQRARQFGEFKGGGAGQIGCFRNSRNVGQRGCRTRCNDNPVGRNGGTVDDHAAGGDLCRAFEIGNPVIFGQQVDIFFLAQRFHQRILGRH